MYIKNYRTIQYHYEPLNADGTSCFELLVKKISPFSNKKTLIRVEKKPTDS